MLKGQKHRSKQFNPERKSSEENLSTRIWELEKQKKTKKQRGAITVQRRDLFRVLGAVSGLGI